MIVAVTGSSGLIGSALTTALRADGHEVRRLVRRRPNRPDEVYWDPAGGQVGDLTGVSAAVHLAGAGVSDHRWTTAYRRTIRDSRIQGTRALATALARLDPTPTVLVSGSAIGWYGDTGARAVDERAGAGAGFLADVVRAWEAAAEPARAAGIRVVHPRTGLVMSRRGGALARMLPIFRLGLGGRLGSGRQYWSVVSLADEVAALRFLLTAGGVRGPVNVTAPDTPTNAQFTAALARALRRPAVLPVPGPALRLALGGFAGEVLASQRVAPAALTAAGFRFAHPDADAVAQAALED